MTTKPQSKAKGCLISAAISILVCVIGLAVLSFPFYWAWKDEPEKEARAIAIGDQLSSERSSELIAHARDIISGKPYSLPPQNSGMMWDDKYGYPEELADIKPARIDVISSDEVWFTIYKCFDNHVVIAVVGLTTKPKVILRTGLDEKYQFHDRKILYEK